MLEGLASIADPNANIQVAGSYSIPQSIMQLLPMQQHLLPTILGLKVADKTYSLDDITVSAKNQGKDSYFDLEAPFASIHVNGEYDYATLTKSFTNRQPANCRPFRASAKETGARRTISPSRQKSPLPRYWQRMLGIPLKIEQPAFADGFMNDAEKTVNIYASVPDFSYDAKTIMEPKCDCIPLTIRSR